MALSSDGSVLLAGAYRVNSNSGAAWVLERNDATWSANPTTPSTTALAPLLSSASITVTNSHFGSWVGLSGDATFASVGAYSYGPGLAVTFSESASQWAYNADITPAGLTNNAFYGVALSVASDVLTVAVGALGYNSFTGTAYVSDFY